MPERILLFGGSFDPVHNGHLIVSRAHAEQCGFDRVTLVPAASAPHKDGAAASARDRLEMLKLAIAGDAFFDISTLELDRPAPSYTYDTLIQLRQTYGPGVQLNWLIGADMLEDFPSWRRAGEVAKLAKIVVTVRPPWDERISEILTGLKGRIGADVLQDLENALVKGPLIDISSTQIRQRVRQGQSIRYLIPDGVLDYIASRKLYV